MRRRLTCLIATVLVVGTTLAYWWNDWRIERYVRVARSALKARDSEGALIALEKAAKIAPNSGEVQFVMARAYRLQGRLEDVRACLERAHKVQFSKTLISREEWLAMAQAGQMAQAEPHLVELLLDPGDDGAEICEAYANGYLLAYRFADAFRVVDAWQKEFPNDPQPHVFRGLVANKSSAWTEAAEHFQKAFELDSKRTDIQLKLADALLALRKTDEAASHFRQLTKTCPNSPEVQTGLGRTLVEQGHLGEARELFSRVLKTYPNDYDAVLALGELELNNNHLEPALTLLQQALKLNPDDPEVRNALAGALQRAGRTTEARTHFEFVANAQEVNLKMQALRERITANAKDLDARFALAELLLGNGNQTDRITWLRSIVEIDPKYQRAHAALAEHYEKVGDRKLASLHRAQSQTLLENTTLEDKPNQ